MSADGWETAVTFIERKTCVLTCLIAFVLFMPADAADQISVKSIRDDWLGYIWRAFVLTMPLTFVSVFRYTNRRVIGWFSQRLEMKKAEEARAETITKPALRLNSLANAEHGSIVMCLFRGMQSFSARMAHTADRGSCNKGMVATAFMMLAVTTVMAAGTGPLSTQDLARMTIEELANIQITSVSKKAEPLSDAAAAVYVITADDIRRAGVTTLPEALRLAPNLQVARVNATKYAISARGFNNSIGNKLLVLIDGRTVYTPLFSGVFWDQQDVMLEDVERIEVISGPGATLWGANAVNGVINVITRSAHDTQGALAFLGGGNREQGGAFRYGGKLGAAGHFPNLWKDLRSSEYDTRQRHVGAGRARKRAGWIPR